MQSEKDAREKRLRDVHRRWERWRSSRGRKPGRIPHELWRMAAEAAAMCGAEATAARLRVDPSRLRGWMDSQDGMQSRGEQQSFVELPALPFANPAECTLELEEPSGRKLRIALRGQATAQAMTLSQMLWRAPS